MKKLLFTVLLCFYFPRLFACLILFITDGHQVLVANHEDWYAADAEVTFIPATGHDMGMVYFDFASEKTAQGGMNEAGLFFDGTRTPYAPYPENQHKPDCQCYPWQKILATCKTVEEAIAFVQKFRIPEIEDIHVLFADRTGNSAVIGVYDGQLQIHRRQGDHQLLTNFNLSNPSYGDEPPCTRFSTATSLLAHDSSVTVANLEKILSKTHQADLTAYSNIYDLTRKEVYVYVHARFTKRVRFNLAEELRKGKHVRRLDKLF